MAILGIIEAFYQGEIGAQLENIIQGLRLRPLRLYSSHKPQVMNRCQPPLVFRGHFLSRGVK